MKKYFKGFYMSLGMFCAVPLPSRNWDDAYKNLALASLPLVGGIIGAFWWGAAELLVLSGVHAVPAAAIVALVPFFATGFIHLDGYMDTSDAALSRRSAEEKLRILKDPHTGAFAVIMIAVLFVLQFASAYAAFVKAEYLALFAAITVISRCCAAMSVFCLKIMPQSGYANMFRQNTGAAQKWFVIIIAVIPTVLSFLYAGFSGLIITAVAALGYIAAMAFAYKDFKGVSGDLVGFSIVIGELCGLFALAVI